MQSHCYGEDRVVVIVKEYLEWLLLIFDNCAIIDSVMQVCQKTCEKKCIFNEKDNEVQVFLDVQ